jgi:hypothetical protein
MPLHSGKDQLSSLKNGSKFIDEEFVVGDNKIGDATDKLFVKNVIVVD